MLPNISEQEQTDLKVIINHLLSVNFLLKETDKGNYFIAKRQKAKLEEFFSFLGWDFIFDDRHEVVFVSSPKAMHQRRLSREESIWLLVIRLIYQEKREGISLSNIPMATLYEIKAKYEAFKLPELQKTRLTDFIRLCSQYQLMEAIDQDWHSDDCRFRLFHSWLYMIDGDSVEKISHKLARYEIGDEGESSDEVVKETETR